MKVTLYIVARCQSGIPVDVDVFTEQGAAYENACSYEDAADYDDGIDAVEVFEREVEIPGVVGHRDF